MQTLFFLTKGDVVGLLQEVEANASVAYARMGAFSAGRVELYLSALEIPRLGEATADSSIASQSFLVVPRATEVVLRHSGHRVFLDQLVNPQSIEFTPGGEDASGALLQGRVGTVHDRVEAKKLLAAYRLTLRHQCKRIKGLYLGAEAEKRWRTGTRLTASVGSPPEYDLATILSSDEPQRN
jgi:hypothetical protein